MDTKHIQEEIMDWVMTCVIGWKLCPFAAQSVIENRIRIHIIDPAEPVHVLSAIHDASTHMLSNDSWINTLIVTPHHWENFYDYWNMVGEVEEYLYQQGWEGKIQVASFHPQYRFDGEDEVSTFTNRSPYPIFHLLHEDEISHVLEHYKDATNIAHHNIKRLQTMGLDQIEYTFAQHQWDRALASKKSDEQDV